MIFLYFSSFNFSQWNPCSFGSQWLAAFDSARQHVAAYDTILKKKTYTTYTTNEIFGRTFI